MVFLCLICSSEFRNAMGSRGVEDHVREAHAQQPEWGVNVRYLTREETRRKHAGALPGVWDPETKLQFEEATD